MSLSLSPLPVEKGPARADAPRLARLALALLAGGDGLRAAAIRPPRPPPEVRPPAEVRTAPAQFIVVAVANPVTGRPAAVGGTAHGYGTTTNYRVSATATSLIRELARNHSLTLVSEWPIEQLQMHCVLFRIPPGTTREAVIEKLMTDKRVLIAQPLNEFESATTRARRFDDPYARLQSNVNALDVAEAHNISRGAGIRVAIIDTGVDTEHPDLAGRTQVTRNYIDDDAAEFRNDRHGTQVAGLIAAAANNGIGIVGVAPDVRLMAYKACWQPTPSSAGPLQFLHAGAGAGRRARRQGAGHQSQPGRPQRSAARGAGRQGHRGRRHRGRRRVRRIRASDFPAKLPRVLPVAEAEILAERDDILRAPARDIVTLVPNGHYDFASGKLARDRADHRRGRAAAGAQPEARRREAARAADQSTERHDTTRGPFLSVNACAALAQVVRGAVCGSR